jgi:serine/threonine protein kinase
LGVVLYEMVADSRRSKERLTVTRAFRSSITNRLPLVQHVANVPRQLERIVSKALAKDRLKRYQTITDLKLDLEQLRDELHTSDSPELIRHSPSVTKRRSAYRQCQPARSQVETVTDPSTSFQRAPVDTNTQAMACCMAHWDCLRARCSRRSFLLSLRGHRPINSVAILAVR